MAQFPLQEGNDIAVADSINLLLSGPSGLGQDFTGYEQWTPGYLTANYRIPYTQNSVNKNCTGVNGDAFVSANPDAEGILVGMTVSGYGIAGGTTVTSIGAITPGGRQVNLSASITADIKNDLTFSPNPVPQIYVAPISLSTSEWLDPYNWKYTFASPQAAPPFVPGNTISVAGVTPSDYDGDFVPIGVTECTTTYVIAKTADPYADPGPGSGGTVELYNTSAVPKVYVLSTDCNSKIVVSGGTDRVFLSAQLNNKIAYTATTSSDLSYAVAINRYRGFPNTDPNNPGYYFEFDKLIAKRVYTGGVLNALNGSGTLDNIETIFSNFPDTNIAPAYYWYILDVSFQVTNGGDLQVTSSELGLRSLSTQVVKQ